MIDQLRGFFEEHIGDELISAYLFGSHAAGRAHRESDVDIAVLLDRNRKPSEADRFDYRLRLATQLGEALGVGPDRVDVVILNDVHPMLGRAAACGGIPIVVRNAAADHEYRRDIQLRAADLEPFLRRMRKIKLEALA